MGEAGGSQGQMLNLELRQRLPGGFTVAGLYDWGRVRVHHNSSFAGAPALNDHRLSGLGLTLTWANSRGSSVTGTWARRVGSNPPSGTAGKDQDGTRQLNRLWLLFTQRF